MEKLVKKIKQNIPFVILVNKIKFFSKNKKMSKWIKQFEKIDSILDFETFKNSINMMLNDKNLKKPYMIQGYATESLLYGHFNSLCRYALNTKGEFYYLPKIEHGVNPDISVVPNNEIERFSNFIFQSDYKAEQIHSVDALKPVFILGPYIHYAEFVYSEDKMHEIKKSLGKTLLVFPFHNFEFSSSKSDDETFVNYIMDNYEKKYDTILVSVYWNDVNDKMYKLFEERGAKLVSSGFRGDKNFIDRLKTILYLSDDVCGNAFGTHIGYALYMNKRYFHIKTDRIFKDEKTGEIAKSNTKSYDQALCDLFQYENIENCNLNNKEIKQFIEKYWGKEKDIKSPKEIHEIIDICKHIYDDSKGYSNKYNDVVNKYKKANNYLILNAISIERD